jgi:hypothetical protein
MVSQLYDIRRKNGHVEGTAARPAKRVPLDSNIFGGFAPNSMAFRI